MKTRIPGFDLARAYAIFGMFIVNFNTVFGSHKTASGLGWVLNLFNGNSSSTFVILAGMGVLLMSNQLTYSDIEKKQLRQTVTRRSWFLFVLGLLLYTWWPADILHFYGGFMHIAALLLFVPKQLYMWTAAGAIGMFHLLFALIPFDNGWNFDTLMYTDFWTVGGFLRNTLYNGWNPIFPWLAYFLLGMWLGRLDWQQKQIRQRMFLVGVIVFALVESLQAMAAGGLFGTDLTFYITADYLPPFLPFMLGTTSFSLMLLVVCLELGDRFANHAVLRALTQTGQMTLTHYILHLTLGITLFSALTGHDYTGTVNEQQPESPSLILAFAMGFYACAVGFSTLWRRRFPHGPLELLMRKMVG